ncbi:helix-turn-helix domain-containing protein [Turicibacter sanguinis]|uniref:helix-turn-helix domain-containing protein n=1 Tax=Turicibacter sanguinis TaxID=154288 RepID=UPI0012BC13C2|nr:helix-turn-helix transcriptional regulator [Turicibacter sanguinis]MDB8437286.1 helix-turn-helix transcriptional regulator [Turicibacter sanguinis]MTO22769.1 helix-turn-helix domain-containing protein [Turicibacter sanguinis]MTO25904.1 helix-turn-helix domain-containing protein [Turicibacter sanguinis]MTO88810.1 helix-turn-helix domain-containing protein [Turicibacter sanguinis]MTP68746.1 helix-turn-helix domain-containing protein [Turicibacter sanguinis]
MMKVNELKGMMVSKGYTQEMLAKELGISRRTLGSRLKCGVFRSNEIEKLIEVLDIKDPVYIFFA